MPNVMPAPMPNPVPGGPMPGPGPRQPIMNYGGQWRDDGAWPVIGHVAWLLVLVAIVAVVSIVVLRLAEGRVRPSATASHDPALAELRLRYARGDVTRDDYLARLGDLHPEGVPGAAPPAVA